MSSSTTLPLRSARLNLESPKIMGILNVTPDSFSDGGEFLSVNKAIDRIGEMIHEGASIIDVGGESTRPGSDPVPLSAEIERVIPLLQKAIKFFPNTLFSIDTTKFEVAKQAFESGVHILNDVSGLEKEPRFAELCAEYNAGYVLMHSQGDPKTMQKNPEYNDVVGDILQFLQSRVEHLREASVESIMVDPGIGFGKTLSHNLQIISKLGEFTKTGCPILVGASRKSMIGQILNNRDVEGRLAGTIAVHYHALINGAKILRVHDVREAADSILVFNEIKAY